MNNHAGNRAELQWKTVFVSYYDHCTNSKLSEMNDDDDMKTNMGQSAPFSFRIPHNYWVPTTYCHKC